MGVTVARLFKNKNKAACTKEIKRREISRCSSVNNNTISQKDNKHKTVTATEKKTYHKHRPQHKNHTNKNQSHHHHALYTRKAATLRGKGVPSFISQKKVAIAQRKTKKAATQEQI
jgi:hypothetical protein